MTITYYHDLEQRTPPWYEIRNGLVTASSVGKLLTDTLRVANNDTSRSLTRTLVAERLTGFGDDTYTSPDMWRGILHEEPARDYYSGYYQQAIECGFVIREEDGWTLGLSPDGLVADHGGLEIKCPRQQEHVRTILADEVPSKYMAQIQAALLVTQRDWWDYCSFSSGLPLYVKRVYPDPAWHQAIEQACRAFEQNAISLVADYRNRVADMPTTQRIQPLDDLEFTA